MVIPTTRGAVYETESKEIFTSGKDYAHALNMSNDIGRGAYAQAGLGPSLADVGASTQKRVPTVDDLSNLGTNRKMTSMTSSLTNARGESREASMNHDGSFIIFSGCTGSDHTSTECVASPKSRRSGDEGAISCVQSIKDLKTGPKVNKKEGRSRHTFVPRRTPVTIKTPAGKMVDIEVLKKMAEENIKQQRATAPLQAERVKTPEATRKESLKQKKKRQRGERAKGQWEEEKEVVIEKEEGEEERVRRDQKKPVWRKQEEMMQIASDRAQQDKSHSRKVWEGDNTESEGSAKDKPCDESTIRIGTAIAESQVPVSPPGLEVPSPRSQTAIQPPTSALATARAIEDLGSVAYPEGINSPKAEMNVNAKRGKFKYDRDFLLQFMEVCKEKPHTSAPWLGAFGLGPFERTSPPVNDPYPGRRASSAVLAPPSKIDRLPITAAKSKMSTEERLAMLTRSMPMSNNPGESPMVHITEQPNKRTRSRRGRRSDVNKADTGLGSFRELSANRWRPSRLMNDSEKMNTDSSAAILRKIRALLNKLTLGRFDTLSDQIVAWTNQSEKEKNGRILDEIVRLVFDGATDETRRSEMYARLCRKMMEQISPNVQDDSVKNAEGKPVAGGQLFRKCLLRCCQEAFEQDWMATALAAAMNPEDQKAKWHALVLFVGELFKQQILTERIIHKYVNKLLDGGENHEEKIESLCALLTAVGQQLDTPRARRRVDVYFSRMGELRNNPNNSLRTRFMLQDIIELRERQWRPRTKIIVVSKVPLLSKRRRDVRD